MASTDPEALKEAADVLAAVMTEVGERPLPTGMDDADGWLDEASAVVRDVTEPGVSGWLCVVAALTLWGPRTLADPEALAVIVAESEGGEPADLAEIFTPVVQRWREIGAVDEQDRLTSLGWWGLPEALLRSWA
jgi:hypothetical protein